MEASLVMELVRNGVMKEREDFYSVLERHLRLWREDGPRCTTYTPRHAPTPMLKEATNVEFGDFIATGFALWSHANQWDWNKPPFLDPKSNAGMPWETRAHLSPYLSHTRRIRRFTPRVEIQLGLP